MGAFLHSLVDYFSRFNTDGRTGGHDRDGIREGCRFFDSGHIVYPCGLDLDPLLFHGVCHLQECVDKKRKKHEEEIAMYKEIAAYYREKNDRNG